METRFEILTPEQAMQFPNFIFPHVLNDRDSDRYFYYAAIADNRLVGMLVESGTIAEPEILSLGVSPEYTGQGIASGLLNLAINTINARIPKEYSFIPNSINVMLSAPAEELDALKRLYQKFGFETERESSYYRIPVSMLKDNPLLQNKTTMEKVVRLHKQRRIFPLKETSLRMVKSFGNLVIHNGILAEFDPDILDEEYTYFASDNTSITAAILFQKKTNGISKNLLLYTKEEDTSSMTLGYLLTAATTAVLKNCEPEDQLMFWIGLPATSKLIAKIFPDAEPASEVVNMILPLGIY